MLCVVPTVTASKSKICGLALFFLETSCHVRCLSIVIFIQDVVPSGGACPKKSLWRRCSDFKKTWVSSKVQFALAWSTSGVTGAMNIRSYQPFCFTRLPTCWPIPISDTSELNWQPNLSCLLSMHNTLPCFLNAFTLSFFAKKQPYKDWDLKMYAGCLWMHEQVGWGFTSRLVLN